MLPTLVSPTDHKLPEGPRGTWRVLSVFAAQKSVQRPSARTFSPPADVYETAKDIVVRMEIAGVDPTAIDIVISPKEQMLTISGQRVDPGAGQPRKYYNMEIECGPFGRQIRLPAPIDDSEATAHYSGGFLVIVIPKAPRSPRTVRSVSLE